MNKNKLWSFGCSHSAGVCLSKDISKHALEKFYKKHGAKDFSSFYNRYNVLAVERLHKGWQKKYKDPINPDLSFAGRLAKKLNLEFQTHSYSGAGLDRVLHNFLNKVDEIDFANDIVLMELPPVYRYMIDSPEKLKNLQYALSLNKKSKEVVPCLETLEIFYTVSVQFIKLKYPSVHFIKIRDQDISLEDMNITPLCEISLGELNEQLGNPQYPSGHYWIDTHEKYADLLKEKL